VYTANNDNLEVCQEKKVMDKKNEKVYGSMNGTWLICGTYVAIIILLGSK